MSDIAALKQEIVTANRILAKENVLDSFGHISCRHPNNPNHFFMSRARAPEVLVEEDIMEFTLTGEVVGPTPAPGKPYSERFIHGAILEARPDVVSVIHNHSPSVIPFSVTGKKMRPIMHMCAPIGNDIPTWDIRTKFGDATNLLVTNMDMARDLAKTLGGRRVSLMRGHGSVIVGKSIREVVFNANYMEKNADMLIKALGMGEVEYLSDGEVATADRGRAGFTLERGWENWCNKVGRPYISQEWEMGPGFSKTDQ
ncbi:MAG: class II aldolase/adducin family protein [Beijerinckiaceae bacterium]